MVWCRESTKYGPPPWTRSMNQVHQNIDRVHGPPLFTTPYKQRPLACLIAGSCFHVTLPTLSCASNMADVDESKQCSFYYDSFEFPCRFFLSYTVLMFLFSILHVDEY